MSTETLVAAPAAATPPALPAQRVDAFGQARIDYKTIALLALPLMLNSGLQAIVSLTDTWFVGHISTSAIAAMGAVYWVVLLFLVLGPWKSRWRMLLGALAGVALGSYLLIDLDLVSRAIDQAAHRRDRGLLAPAHLAGDEPEEVDPDDRSWRGFAHPVASR